MVLHPFANPCIICTHVKEKPRRWQSKGLSQDGKWATLQ
jgi:hypothetical protein